MEKSGHRLKAKAVGLAIVESRAQATAPASNQAPASAIAFGLSHHWQVDLGHSHVRAHGKVLAAPAWAWCGTIGDVVRALDERFVEVCGRDAVPDSLTRQFTVHCNILAISMFWPAVTLSLTWQDT